MRSCVLERKTISAWREMAGGGGGERMKNRGGRRGCRRTGKTVLYVRGEAVDGEVTANLTCLTCHRHSLTLSLSHPLSLSVTRSLPLRS